MTRESFRESYPSGPHTLSGSLLGRQHRALNELSSERQAGSKGGFRTGHIRGENTFPPVIIGIAKISSAANTCTPSTDPGEEFNAPCARENLYLARFRFWDPVNKQWAEEDEDYTLDAGAYYSETPGLGEIPKYEANDTVSVYFDGQRGVLVPLDTVPPNSSGDVAAEYVSQTSQTIPQTSMQSQDNLDSKAEMVLEIKRPSDQDWRPMTVLAWHLPYTDNLRNRRDTRSNFAMVAAPHNTLIRLRMVQASRSVTGPKPSPSEDAPTTEEVINTNWTQMKFSGIGPLMATSFFSPHEVATLPGGILKTGWKLRASQPAKVANAPTFAVVGNDTFIVKYTEPQLFWMIGIEVSGLIIPEPSVQSQKKSLVRFTLLSALTTSDDEQDAIITDQYGPGEANTAASIVVRNLEVSTAGTYLFEGDSGDAGYAMWDSGDHYTIIQIECP